MMEPSRRKFLIVESDAQYASWLRHSVSAGWPNDDIVLMDWSSFTRVHTAMTARDYDIVLLTLKFDEFIEEPTNDSFDWIRRLRSQPHFPEMIILAEGGSELVAIRTLRLGAADYLPKRLVNPSRLQRSIKLTLRAIEKQAQRRAERLAQASAAAAPAAEPAAAAPARQPAPVAVVMQPAATAEAPAQASEAAPPAHAVETAAPVSTHTGARLAAAAQAAIAAKPADAPSPISTQTGQVMARAARVALASVPTPPRPVAASPEPSRPDPAAASLPAAAVSSPPEPVKDVKPVAPPHHQIPGYTILQKIGESEAAAVYLAIAEDLGHNVALKVSKRLHSGNSDSADTGQRSIMFQREFEAIAALDHPSIIDLFDYGIHEGVEYLAMEYFPCGDLKARLQNPLTPDEAIAFLREIARSLKVVHDAGIIHRDLKPPNVMLRADGSVVLIDFGLARSLLAGDGSTRTGVLRGSPYYMSPEQAQGEVLDARTDLYSLGIILYEMLAGRKPYLGASAIDVLQQHVMAPVPELPLQHLHYQPLLERLMSKSREQRIGSCDELLRALDEMEQARKDGGIVDPATLVSAGVGS